MDFIRDFCRLDYGLCLLGAGTPHCSSQENLACAEPRMRFQDSPFLVVANKYFSGPQDSSFSCD